MISKLFWQIRVALAAAAAAAPLSSALPRLLLLFHQAIQRGRSVWVAADPHAFRIRYTQLVLSSVLIARPGPNRRRRRRVLDAFYVDAGELR